MYLDRALYSKGILFEREKQKIYADVITYAGVAEYVCGVGDKELREAMLDAEYLSGIQKLFMEVKGRYNIRRSWVITTWFLIGCFRNSKTKMVFEILMAWENEFVKIFTLFPEIHAPVLSHFITLKHYS